jgi:ribosomal protein S18 acetylase RimI-like enzyme
MPDIIIRPLTTADAEACDQIILSLPYHFGNAAGREACALAVRSSAGWVAEQDDRVLGFLTLHPHFIKSIEITWMAVHNQSRRQGIGRRLIQHICQDLQVRGYQLLFVSTLAPSVEEKNTTDNYHGTHAFYQAVGFLPLCEAPNYWGVNSSPALLLVLPLLTKLIAS